jgi:hypothetical protein
MNNEIMIDIETLGVRPGAVILTIGAIKFDRVGTIKQIEQMDTFYRRIQITSCEEVGLTTEQDTINWWHKQDKQVFYETIENPDRVPIKQALIDFSEWFGDSKIVWANSPNFDCVMVEDAMNRCGLQVPWKFWNLRDCRTIFDIGGVRLKDFNNKQCHNAIQDCYVQISALKHSLSILLVNALL